MIPHAIACGSVIRMITATNEGRDSNLPEGNQRECHTGDRTRDGRSNSNGKHKPEECNATNLGVAMKAMARRREDKQGMRCRCNDNEWQDKWTKGKCKPRTHMQ